MGSNGILGDLNFVFQIDLITSYLTEKKIHHKVYGDFIKCFGSVATVRQAESTDYNASFVDSWLLLTLPVRSVGECLRSYFPLV